MNHHFSTLALVYPKPKNGNLLRVSVGCEDVEDVIADFAQALERI